MHKPLIEFNLCHEVMSCMAEFLPLNTPFLFVCFSLMTSVFIQTCSVWKNISFCIIAECFLCNLSGLISPVKMQNKTISSQKCASLNSRL